MAYYVKTKTMPDELEVGTYRDVDVGMQLYGDAF